MTSSRPNPPTAASIARYWDSNPVYTTSDGKKIHGYMDLSNGQTLSMVTDIGEPSCFACHCWDSKWDVDKFKKGDHKHNEQLIDYRWNNAHGLEKAHIVSYGGGGSNTVSNFVLLCRHCHFAIDSHSYRVGDYFDSFFLLVKGRSEQKSIEINKIWDDFLSERKYTPQQRENFLGVSLKLMDPDSVLYRHNDYQSKIDFEEGTKKIDEKYGILDKNLFTWTMRGLLQTELVVKVKKIDLNVNITPLF